MLAQLERDIREQLQVPPTHHILFTQGGGSTQFSSVVLNMLARHRLLYPNLRDDERITDYVITGSWSKKAVDEAQRLGGAKVNVVADVRKSASDGKSFQRVPARNEYKFSPNPVLVYYCENETVDGVQFAQEGSEADDNAFPFDLLPGGAVPPLVADYSSSFMSRRIPRLADHAVIFAGAQKNIGPSGLTIVIVRDDCLVDVDAAAKLGSIPVPLMLSYKVLKDTNSVYNTPATFSIYVAGLVLERMRENGGLEAVEAINRRKQKKVFDAVSAGEAKGLFHLKVQDGSRSWMNVVFTGKTPETEKEFLAAGESLGFKAMKGHRSVGGT